ncbi:rho GTPase-activating protein 7 isoform X1 [Hydra vulgaris]|uniref:rho GTPase-activating protein 7 isoform X1 n=4 Tax=Hydra vulgaris TaxID=6087 RepID=UPI001F5E706B|nr:rho GTPase-activating protein 7 [Hydra vulgaris]
MNEFEIVHTLTEKLKHLTTYAMNSNVIKLQYRMIELEAFEACCWLKATGFSLFAKMYEEKCFPLEVGAVKIACNHLDVDSLQSLIKRLETLNKCAKILQNMEKNQLLNRLDADQLEFANRQPLIDIDQNTDSNQAQLESFPDRFPLKFDEDLGIKKDDIDLMNSEFLICAKKQLTEEIKQHLRNSSYDNVMLDSSMDVLIDSSNQIKITLENLDHHLSEVNTEDEDDNDINSISSLDELDGVNRNSFQGSFRGHLQVPGMGSTDSGVPSTPIMRSPSVRKRRVRWHSFQKSCERESMLISNNIMTLSAGQLNVLKKLSLLRLTALIERYSCNNRTSWHWTVPKILKKLKVHDYKDKNIFGVPLLTIAERTGCPLPHSVVLAINYLSRVAKDSIGIFRKSGMKSRIEKLKIQIELNPSKIDLDGYSAYDVADMLKQFFRELPEPLLTTKLSDTFIAIHKDIPSELRLQAMQLAVILMPDENRHVLQTILSFLNEVASYSSVNQMSEANLATCFVPALFHLCGGGASKNDKNINNAPKKMRRSISLQYQKELDDTRAAQECLACMMKCVNFLFCVPDDVMMKCRFTYIEQGEPVPLEKLGQNGVDPGIDDDYRHHIDTCFSDLLQETSVNSRSTKWDIHSECDEITISYRKVNDGYPLRVWRAVTEVQASPEEILKRIIKERHLWDDEILEWQVIDTLDDCTDVFYYETQSIAPSVKRDFVILRSWRYNLNGGSCGVVMTSVKHKNEPPTSGVRATLLAFRCLIEPIGLGRSRLTSISRIDYRGTSSRYYNKVVSPRVMSSGVRKIRDSFNCGPDGPETNV